MNETASAAPTPIPALSLHVDALNAKAAQFEDLTLRLDRMIERLVPSQGAGTDIPETPPVSNLMDACLAVRNRLDALQAKMADQITTLEELF